MSLEQLVKDRYGADFIRSITNPGVTGASAADDTRLTAAANSAKARFADVVGVTYDETIERHTELCIEGTILYLRIRRGMSIKEEREEKTAWTNELRDYAGLNAEAWVEPTTNSQLSPTREAPSGQTVRPFADNENFTNMEPRAPHSLSSDDDE